MSVENLIRRLNGDPTVPNGLRGYDFIHMLRTWRNGDLAVRRWEIRDDMQRPLLAYCVRIVWEEPGEKRWTIERFARSVEEAAHDALREFEDWERGQTAKGLMAKNEGGFVG